MGDIAGCDLNEGRCQTQVIRQRRPVEYRAGKTNSRIMAVTGQSLPLFGAKRILSEEGSQTARRSLTQTGILFYEEFRLKPLKFGHACTRCSGSIHHPSCQVQISIVIESDLCYVANGPVEIFEKRRHLHDRFENRS